MAKEVKILALANRQILISEIEEVGSAILENLIAN